MDLRQLEHFLAVAEEQHFTRAARRVNIVQSGLSASIRALEEELGAALFIRSTRKVDLTAAGRVLFEEARRVLAAARGARDAVAAVQGLARGRLAIGTAHSLSPFVDLPALLARFHAAHPGVEIRLCQGSSAVLTEKLRDGRLDLAFVPMQPAPPADIRTTMLACEELVAACSHDHPLAGRRAVPLERLGRETFVDFQTDWGTRQLVDQAFARVRMERHTGFEVNDLATALDLVALGLGIALVPEAIIAAHPADPLRPKLAVATLAPPDICWELGIAHAERGAAGLGTGPANPAAREFLALMAEDTIAAAA
jgi:DNA-binding transcriptional LysR family regulator